MYVLELFMAGAAGSLVKDVVTDNQIVLPKFNDGCILLGFLGGIIIGGAVGYLVDQNPATAFFSGYAGSQMLTSLIPDKKKD